MKTTYPISTISEIIDLTLRRIYQLVTDGIIPKNTERDVIDDGTGMTTLMLEAD